MTPANARSVALHNANDQLQDAAKSAFELPDEQAQLDGLTRAIDFYLTVAASPPAH